MTNIPHSNILDIRVNPESDKDKTDMQVAINRMVIFCQNTTKAVDDLRAYCQNQIYTEIQHLGEPYLPGKVVTAKINKIEKTFKSFLDGANSLDKKINGVGEIIQSHIYHHESFNTQMKSLNKKIALLDSFTTQRIDALSSQFKELNIKFDIIIKLMVKPPKDDNFIVSSFKSIKRKFKK